MAEQQQKTPQVIQLPGIPKTGQIGPVRTSVPAERYNVFGFKMPSTGEAGVQQQPSKVVQVTPATKAWIENMQKAALSGESIMKEAAKQQSTSAFQQPGSTVGQPVPQTPQVIQTQTSGALVKPTGISYRLPPQVIPTAAAAAAVPTKPLPAPPPSSMPMAIPQVAPTSAAAPLSIPMQVSPPPQMQQTPQAISTQFGLPKFPPPLPPSPLAGTSVSIPPPTTQVPQILRQVTAPAPAPAPAFAPASAQVASGSMFLQPPILRQVTPTRQVLPTQQVPPAPAPVVVRASSSSSFFPQPIQAPIAAAAAQPMDIPMAMQESSKMDTGEIRDLLDTFNAVKASYFPTMEMASLQDHLQQSIQKADSSHLVAAAPFIKKAIQDLVASFTQMLFSYARNDYDDLKNCLYRTYQIPQEEKAAFDNLLSDVTLDYGGIGKINTHLEQLRKFGQGLDEVNLARFQNAIPALNSPFEQDSENLRVALTQLRTDTLGKLTNNSTVEGRGIALGEFAEKLIPEITSRAKGNSIIYDEFDAMVAKYKELLQQ